MPKLFIITEEWNKQPWFNTGGTREKKYLQSPDGKFYYFKRSQLKPHKDYRFEFWNEIIAYELGSMLGFNMLRYDAAIDGDIMGCICQSMINADQEELIEGIKYLQAFSPTYELAKKEHQKWYTFNLIEEALKSSKIGHFVEDIIKIIIFDSLISNGDRHQENWAVITHQKLILDNLEKADLLKLKKWQSALVYWVNSALKKGHDKYEKSNQKLPKMFYEYEKIFAPIYDSGSSLGRELLEDKVNIFLKNEAELNRYIEKGVSEIHWNNTKMSHFKLIGNLLESQHTETVKNLISGLFDKFDIEKFTELVHGIDLEVPIDLAHYKIPFIRKQLIIKMITLRLKKLKALIYEGV